MNNQIDVLDRDPERPGQKFVCLSFLFACGRPAVRARLDQTTTGYPHFLLFLRKMLRMLSSLVDLARLKVKETLSDASFMSGDAGFLPDADAPVLSKRRLCSDLSSASKSLVPRREFSFQLTNPRTLLVSDESRLGALISSSSSALKLGFLFRGLKKLNRPEERSVCECILPWRGDMDGAFSIVFPSMPRGAASQRSLVPSYQGV